MPKLNNIAKLDDVIKYAEIWYALKKAMKDITGQTSS